MHTYKTIDKDGKVLLDEFQEIVKTDLNNYTSTRNGKKFKISHTESEISVFDCQKKSISNLIWKNSSTQN